MPLLLDNDSVAAVLDPSAMIRALDDAYRAFAAGEGVCAPRLDFQSRVDGGGEAYQLGTAIGLAGRYGTLRIKSDRVAQRIVDGRPRKEKYCVRPGTYMGLVLLFDQGNGELVAILHDGLIQQMRVGCDSAIGVRYMAREDAQTLGILGAGGMAGTHAEAIAKVRDLRRILVYSPTRSNREAFARRFAERLDLEIVPVDDPATVFAEADILSACTNAVGPVVHGELLRPGQHVTCIGGTLDEAASARVDRALRLGTASAPAGLEDWGYEDECLTFAEGGTGAAHGGTRRFADIPVERRIMLRDIVNGVEGRESADQITFSERGNIHGLQFAAAAGLIYEAARAAGQGVELDGGLFLQSIRN